MRGKKQDRKQIHLSDDDGFISNLLLIYQMIELGKKNRDYILKAMVRDLKAKRLTNDQLDYINMVESVIVRKKDFQQSASMWQPINHLKRLFGMIAGGQDNKAIMEKKHFFLERLEINRHNQSVVKEIKALNNKKIDSLRKNMQYAKMQGYTTKQIVQLRTDDLTRIHSPSGIDPKKTIEYKSVRSKKK